jgi:tetratricopeptide (TPR) repeat protein
MSPASVESRAALVGKWTLACVVPLSALAVGAVPALALAGTSLLSAIACGFLWWDDTVSVSRAAKAVLLAVGILVGMTLLQSVSLPASLVRAIAPANAEIWERCLVALREPGPTWHAISLAPSATRIEVVRGLLYATTFLGALRVAKLEHGETFLVRVVVFSATLMALSALAHAAVGADRVFGIYQPREVWAYRAGHVAPLLNKNHLAAYLNIGACVAFGALVTGRSLPWPLALSAAGVLVATSLLQTSRAATAALLLGIALIVGLTQMTRKRFSKRHVRTLLLAGAAAVSLTLVVLSFAEGRAHLVTVDRVKLDLAKSSVELVRASPWFGSGRGAFETVFSSVSPAPRYVTFTHPEDLFVQWGVEWGIVASLAAFSCLVWAWRPSVLLRAVKPAIGAWTAVVVAAFHEVVDYHFEVPGVVVLAAVCVALVVGARSSSRVAVVVPTSPPWPRWVAASAVLGSVVAVVALRSEIGHSLAEERRALSAAATDRNIDRDAFVHAVRAAMLRFPAEPFFALTGAVRAQNFGEGSVVPWVARALERNPRFGRAHFVLAQSLARSNAAQARSEYRHAYEYDEALRDAIVRQAPFVVDSFDAVLELIPDCVDGAGGVACRASNVALIESLVGVFEQRLPATAVMLDAELERRLPGALGPARRRADAASNDAIEGAPWCDPAAPCLSDALQLADDLVRREPTHCEHHARVARLKIALGRGQVADALQALLRAADNVVERGQCLRQVVQLAFANGEWRRGDAALESLVRGGCVAASECIELFEWAALTEEQRGHSVQAMRLYRRAADLAPEREDLFERMGALGEKDGTVAEALEAYRVLASRHPEDGRWPARIEALRGRSRSAVPTTRH